MDMGRIAIVGDGGWGTAIAVLLYSKGLDVLLWSYSEEYAESLDRDRENVKFLEGVKIPKELKITSDVSVAGKSEYAIFAVPSEYFRSVALQFKDADFKTIISATKGIENGSLSRPSEILNELYPKVNIGVLSGPSIAYEVARNYPSTVAYASLANNSRVVQEMLSNEYFRVYTSRDIVGVELGGALKNVIAIAAGISDGLGFGANTKAAILTRGLAEISRLGIKLGANKDTFSGLSGVGDLATTCMSSHSRNRWFGEELGKGRSVKEILGETEMVVEGMFTCKAANDIAIKNNVDMPITEKIYEIVYKEKDPREAVRELMTRDLKGE
jgi:glycerol-3-phosphate dehydrogenase (NAD(P)+)